MNPPSTNGQLAVDPQYVIQTQQVRINQMTNDLVMAEAYINQQNQMILSLQGQVKNLMPSPDDTPEELVEEVQP